MLSAFLNGQVFGERKGSGAPAVLALHGWRGDHAQMNQVTEGFNAISIDLPGFGRSPEPDDVWGAAEYATTLQPLLDEFEGPVVVVGYSFGGRVAVNLATLSPEKVGSLVLVGVPLIRKAPTSKPPLKFRLAKAAHRLKLISDEKMEAERNKRGSADYRASQGIMRSVFVKLVNESYEKQLAAVNCPVELVWGDKDTEAPLRNAQEAIDPGLLKNAKLTVVPGATHWSIVAEHSEAVREAIKRRLA